MKVKDKIIQIIKGDTYYAWHGLSESGRLYVLKIENDGTYNFEFVCDSPKIEEETLLRDNPYKIPKE